jgi:hypothetical protein
MVFPGPALDSPEQGAGDVGVPYSFEEAERTGVGGWPVVLERVNAGRVCRHVVGRTAMKCRLGMAEEWIFTRVHNRPNVGLEGGTHAESPA